MSLFPAVRRAALVPAAFLLAPAALRAQWPSDLVQVHGFLTQGLAATDSLPVVGIGRRATADYRAAALQVRFAPTRNDAAVVQLANRRMGESALNATADAVELQWAYYQRRLPGGVTAKLGRSPMARGIYNEVRKVGTVLPFYRAPYNFYTESFETVDGAALSRTTRLGRWALDANGFVGTLPYVQKATSSVYRVQTGVVNGAVVPVAAPVAARDTTFLLDRRGDRGVGGQLWLNTPVEGLRVGFGGARFTLNEFGQFSGKSGRVPSSTVQGALEGAFSRVQLRGEWEQQHSNEFLYTAHYQQAGLRVTDKLSLNVQREQANVHVAIRAPMELRLPNGAMTAAAAAPAQRRAYRFARDVAAGANYAFRPNVILKAEAHDNKGANYDRALATPDARGRYVIASLALSF